MIGRLLSFWGGPFSDAILVLGRVHLSEFRKKTSHSIPPVPPLRHHRSSHHRYQSLRDATAANSCRFIWFEAPAIGSPTYRERTANLSCRIPGWDRKDLGFWEGVFQTPKYLIVSPYPKHKNCQKVETLVFQRPPNTLSVGPKGLLRRYL